MNVLGIDFGNVVIDHLTFGTTPEFIDTGDYRTIPPVPDSLEIIADLEKKFGANIFIVYNANQVADAKIHSWLDYHHFFKRTRISPDQVIRTNQGRNKRPLCSELHITHFVDDRLEVLTHLIGEVGNLYLFRPQKHEVEQHKNSLDKVILVDSWKEMWVHLA